MAKRANEFISMQEAVKEMLAENNLQTGITVVEVKQAWKNVMGAGVVSYTQDVMFKKDVLIVKLKSATLREELSYGKDKILLMLNNHLGREVINNLKLT